jgi:ribosome modulation factor
MNSFPRRRDVRKLEIARCRQEGRDAFAAGKHIQTCPYGHMDMMHWVDGWVAARDEAEQEATPEV